MPSKGQRRWRNDDLTVQNRAALTGKAGSPDVECRVTGSTKGIIDTARVYSLSWLDVECRHEISIATGQIVLDGGCIDKC